MTLKRYFAEVVAAGAAVIAALYFFGGGLGPIIVLAAYLILLAIQFLRAEMAPTSFERWTFGPDEPLPFARELRISTEPIRVLRCANYPPTGTVMRLVARRNCDRCGEAHEVLVHPPGASPLRTPIDTGRVKPTPTAFYEVRALIDAGLSSGMAADDAVKAAWAEVEARRGDVAFYKDRDPFMPPVNPRWIDTQKR